MSVDREFGQALRKLIDRDGEDPLLLPARLATVVALLLPVDGASISIANEGFRLPLGASDARSARAEQLQFTAGEGPCLTAIEYEMVITAAEPRLQTRWPTLAEMWRTQTSFRSAVAHPLAQQGRVTTALNLFFLDPNGSLLLDIEQLAAVAAAAGARLSVALGPNPSSVPASGGAADRQQIWVAVGIAMSAWRLDGPDALDRLRAYAYGRGSTLDELAAELIKDPEALNTEEV